MVMVVGVNGGGKTTSLGKTRTELVSSAPLRF